jgi:hypothetical protein
VTRLPPDLPRAAAGWALVAVGLVVVAACSSSPPVSDWAEVALPGAAPRLVRDAVDCGGHWYAVGAHTGADGETSPAAWASADGHTWRSLALAPLPGSYYGPRSVLSAIACARGRIAAVGARSGGAHGNPRVSTWYQRPDGALAEAPATFETYGGGTAVDVGRISGGPAGFLIAGNRTSGAAAWLSADGTAFRLFENAPGLAGPGTLARDGVVLDGGFVLVGGVAATGSLDQAPAAWTSRDGARWHRAAVPAEPGYAELQRVVRLGTDLIAVGPRGGTFGTWRGPTCPAACPGHGVSADPACGAACPAGGDDLRGSGWVAAGRFGTLSPTGVRSLTVANGRVYAAADTLWRSDDRGGSWQKVTPPAGSTPLSAVAGRSDGQVLLVARDRVWRSH